MIMGFTVHQSKRNKGLSLAFSLFIPLILAVSVVGYITGELTGEMERRELYRALENRSEKAFAVLSASLLEPLLTEDVAVMRTVVQQIANSESDLHSVVIRNEDNVVLLRWQRQQPEDSGLIRFRRDVIFEGEHFGSIEIAWMDRAISQVVEKRMERVWFATLLPLGGLTILILLIVHWLAVRPLKKIYRRVLSLSSGDLESSIKPSGSREIRLLAETVNRTTQTMRELKSQQEKLRQANEALFESKELAEVTLHSIGDGVITTDHNGIVKTINPIAEQLTGWPQHEAEGKKISEVFFIVDGESGDKIVNDPVSRALSTGKVVLLEGHTKLITREGEQFAIEDSAAPIRSKDGQILGAVLVFHDVTEQRQMAEKINYQATHDPLTGLMNRNAFELKIQHLLEDPFNDRDGSEHALLYLDLDQFKVVNDTCGHAAGDALLCQLSSLMQSRLRAGDTIARLGGDEFAIILPHCPLDRALHCAEKIRQAVQEYRFLWHGNTFSVGVSIGLVPFRGGQQNHQDIMAAADQACFAAKDRGRDRVHVYQPDDKELARRRQEMNWVAKIHRALERNAFELFYQTIELVREGSKTLTHYEILLRMRDEAGDLVPPGAFLPAAERYDLMGLIDRWVIQHFFLWLAAHPAHLRELHLAGINISGISVSDPHFLAFLTNQFKVTGIPAVKICFEITETVAIANLSQAKEMIQALKELGCCFALDDFGSGMSSFGYLKHMPVDYLKIDGGFVRDIANDPIDYALVKSINEIGHIMGKLTIAEFVENGEILANLREIGVDLAQGYGISKPKPISNLVENHLDTAYNSL